MHISIRLTNNFFLFILPLLPIYFFSIVLLALLLSFSFSFVPFSLFFFSFIVHGFFSAITVIIIMLSYRESDMITQNIFSLFLFLSKTIKKEEPANKTINVDRLGSVLNEKNCAVSCSDNAVSHCLGIFRLNVHNIPKFRLLLLACLGGQLKKSINVLFFHFLFTLSLPSTVLFLFQSSLKQYLLVTSKLLSLFPLSLYCRVGIVD